jgi:hypothetical protein
MKKERKMKKCQRNTHLKSTMSKVTKREKKIKKRKLAAPNLKRTVKLKMEKMRTIRSLKKQKKT